MKRFALVLFVVCASVCLYAQETHLFAQKDSFSLYLDIHRPGLGAQTDFQGLAKPTILHSFGGGFKSGSRQEPHLVKWFKMLNDNGYTVVAIDYRLGMKGYKMGKGLVGVAKSVYRFYDSQQMGVEDIFSAISFLAAHPELGIDINNLVLSGNSAGAIISLASAYDMTNGKAHGLPQNFRLKGVMSFAGAIISLSGAPKFEAAPCPILFFHGLNDNAVAYKHLSAFGRGMWGSSFLATRLKKIESNYNIYRFKNRAHDVAAYMNYLWPEERMFLEKNIMLKQPSIIDATVENDSLPVWKEWGTLSPQEMYNGN